MDAVSSRTIGQQIEGLSTNGRRRYMELNVSTSVRGLHVYFQKITFLLR